MPRAKNKPEGVKLAKRLQRLKKAAANDIEIEGSEEFTMEALERLAELHCCVRCGRTLNEQVEYPWDGLGPECRDKVAEEATLDE